MIFNLKEFLRTNRMTSLLYMYARTIRHRSKFVLRRENTIKPDISQSKEYRINLVLPCFTVSVVFGGILTALKFFENLVDKLNFEARIIVIGEEHYNRLLTYKFRGFNHNAINNGIFFISENPNIEVRNNDIFICTAWKTAFYTYPLLEWQKQKYNLENRKIIYLIQDFEPGFLPWSSDYLLSLSTYLHSDTTIAVFNSKELRNYFRKHEYYFSEEYTFSPLLNENLKKILLGRSGRLQKREKKIVIYGRPISNRNCFELIHAALKIWSEKYPDAKYWKVYSLGDRFINIKLKYNTIEFRGKLSLEEYGEVLLSSYAGISLMVSPHPSYPPLEMATFGVKTITNSFETKDLSGFSDNIISLNIVTPQILADSLCQICDKYEETSTIIVPQTTYISGDSFNNVIQDTANAIKRIEKIV